MKKLLIIDRDGTIITEPAGDCQVDSLEKLEFIPGAITALSRIAALMKEEYLFVLASNQDGLGTASFPEGSFYPAHNKMLRILEGEGFSFDRQLIDRSLPEDHSPARKPGTAMFAEFISGGYDLENSFVIGDRLTDALLASNLGCRAILLDRSGETQKNLASLHSDEGKVTVADSWERIYEYLRRTSRRVTIERCTSETKVRVCVDLDGNGSQYSDTGLKFFDHMLSQISHHSGCSLEVVCKGDLETDEHHTIEDTAMALGDAVRKALGDKRGLQRYGFALPMDDSEATVLLDFGGRSYFRWEVKFNREYVGDVPTEMFPHFFMTLCHAMECNLHIKASGSNTHHLVESVFKAFARALGMAVKRSVFSEAIPSSKGTL